MAAFQECYKWIVVFLPVLAITNRYVLGCHPSSKELHICLNIYLERDFPLIETIVKGQGRFGRGRVILEGPDLADICRHVASLKECYGNLLPECETLWQYDRYMRLMDVLGATHDYLCLNNTNNVRELSGPPDIFIIHNILLKMNTDLLLRSGCLIRAQAHISECTGFNWSMSWREVLRMQVSPQDRCKQLESYRECLKSRLKNVECGSDSSDVYQRLINVWLKHWCGKDLPPDEEKKYFYLTNKT